MNFLTILLAIFFFIMYSICINRRQSKIMLSANFTTGLPEYNQGSERGVSMKKVRKWFSVLLSVLLIAGMVPMAAGAAGPDGAIEAVSQIVYSGEEVSADNDRVTMTG